MDTGIRKAAILLTSLDTHAADTLLASLEDEIVSRILDAADELGDVGERERWDVVAEFMLQIEGNPNEAKRRFEFLHDADEQQLLRILAGERPGTIALVLRYLPESVVESLLARFGETVRDEVTSRLASEMSVDDSVLDEVEAALRVRLMQIPDTQMSPDGIVLNNTGIRKFHAAESIPAKAARSLDVSEVQFDSLFDFNGPDFRKLMGAVGHDLLMLALVGADSQWIERVVSCLSDEERSDVQYRLEHPLPTRLSDVEQARRRIVRLAIELAAEGEIDENQLSVGRPGDAKVSSGYAA